ncbi:MAG: maleylpyruvate isomerase N-terminal domain-containing protein [Dehalococcoidia bacterium]
MTTREELITGLEMIVREGLRTTKDFGSDDWAMKIHDDEGGGWTRKQIYAHLTSTAEISPGFLGSLANAQEGQDAGAGFDIGAFNAQQVAAKDNMSPKDLLEKFKGANDQLVEYVRNMPDEQLQQKRRFGAAEGSVAEIMDSVLVLHGLAHIYLASTRAFV